MDGEAGEEVQGNGNVNERIAAQRLTQTPVETTHDTGACSVRISESLEDPVWDDFLESTSCNAYTQSSGWGRARASIGWKSIRVVVSGDAQVLGGAQMLTRPLPVGGEIGLVIRGPVVRENEPALFKLVFDEVLAMGSASNVKYLIVQPPRGCDWMCDELADLRFRSSLLETSHASVRIDLNPDLGTLMANMHKHRRRSTRSAEKRGLITIRRGSEIDLPAFNRLKDAHCTRLGYTRRDDGYYLELWRALAPRGSIELFLAEYGGQPISALLAIPFGDTCRHMERPWSGEHAELHPNELIEWAAIKWAKSAGYRFTDHGGIPPKLAQAILSGNGVPDDPSYSDSVFKLRFGGQVIIDPPPLDYVYNPVLRLGYRAVPRALMDSAWMGRIVRRLKGSGS